MATFAISMSVEIEADSYEQAYEIRDQLFKDIGEHPEVMDGPFEIDVEQQDGFEEEDDGQPDEMQEWHDFDPDC